MKSIRGFGFFQLGMARLSTLIVGVLLVFGLISSKNLLAAHTDHSGLSVGVFPYLSTRTMLATYEPMRAYLEAVLQRPVNIYTAANYREYYAKAVKGDYDVAIFPPHLALLAQREGGQMPIARFSRVMHGVFVTTSESPINSLQELRGVQLATPDSVALVSILGINQLLELGLLPSRDYVWRPGVSHNSALLNLQRGTAHAALVANSALDQMPPEQRENIRILGRTSDFPALVIMSRRNLPINTRTAIQAALLDWHEQPSGQQLIAALKFAAIVPAQASDLEPFKIYLQATRDALRVPAHEAARR